VSAAPRLKKTARRVVRQLGATNVRQVLFLDAGIVGRIDVIELRRDMPWIWITSLSDAIA